MSQKPESINVIRERQKRANAEKAQVAAQSLRTFLSSVDRTEEDPALGPFIRVLSGVNVVISGQVVEGDRVVSLWTLDGTHDRALPGAAPSRRDVSFSGVTVSVIREDGVEHLESFFDLPSLVRQIEGSEP
jgi:SnoaL-like polyketide cyclase